MSHCAKIKVVNLISAEVEVGGGRELEPRASLSGESRSFVLFCFRFQSLQDQNGVYARVTVVLYTIRLCACAD